MDLHDEFETFAHTRGSESGARLRDASVRARIDARVARGRRVHNAKVGVGTVAAVGALTVGAVMMPRLDWGVSSPGASPSLSGDPSISTGPEVSTAPGDDQLPSQSPSPSPSPSPSRVDVDGLPALGSSNYLAVVSEAWTLVGPPTCEAMAASEPTDGVADSTGQAQSFPIPAWLENGRLYGWGDDVLTGGYPIPVAALGQANFASVQDFVSNLTAEPGTPGAPTFELILTGVDGSIWGFDVSWSERDDLPHDAAGLFVSLSPNYDCNDGTPVQGVYEARLATTTVDRGTVIARLSAITVVGGVPSLPDVDAQG